MDKETKYELLMQLKELERFCHFMKFERVNTLFSEGVNVALDAVLQRIELLQMEIERKIKNNEKETTNH